MKRNTNSLKSLDDRVNSTPSNMLNSQLGYRKTYHKRAVARDYALDGIAKMITSSKYSSGNISSSSSLNADHSRKRHSNASIPKTVVRNRSSSPEVHKSRKDFHDHNRSHLRDRPHKRRKHRRSDSFSDSQSASSPVQTIEDEALVLQHQLEEARQLVDQLDNSLKTRFPAPDPDPGPVPCPESPLLSDSSDDIEAFYRKVDEKARKSFYHRLNDEQLFRRENERDQQIVIRNTTSVCNRKSRFDLSALPPQMPIPNPKLVVVPKLGGKIEPRPVLPSNALLRPEFLPNFNSRPSFPPFHPMASPPGFPPFHPMTSPHDFFYPHHQSEFPMPPMTMHPSQHPYFDDIPIVEHLEPNEPNPELELERMVATNPRENNSSMMKLLAMIREKHEAMIKRNE